MRPGGAGSDGPLMDEYAAGETSVRDYSGLLLMLSCSDTDWSNYGSGRGEEFQQLCKSEPAFAVELCAGGKSAPTLWADSS